MQTTTATLPMMGLKPALVEATAKGLTDYQLQVYDRHGCLGQLWDAVQREIERRGLDRFPKGVIHG